MTSRPFPLATRSARTVDLSAAWNASDADVGARFHPSYADALGRLPDGPSVFRGVPFELGSRVAGRRWILVEDSLEIDLRGLGRASHLVIAHFVDSWRDLDGQRPPGMPVGWVLPTGEPLARYEVTVAHGPSTAVDVRRRFEIADGIIGWGFAPFAAVGHRQDEALDWRGPYGRQEPGRYAPAGHGGALTVLPGSWGAHLTGVADSVPSALDDIIYWLHVIALGNGAEPTRLRIAPTDPGRAGSAIAVAAVTLFDGTADPLRLDARRQLLVSGPDAAHAEVDLGLISGSRPHLPRPSPADPSSPIGWGRPTVDELTSGVGMPGSPRLIDLSAAADARIVVDDWEVPVARLAVTASSPDGRTTIIPMAPPAVRIDVRLTADGEASPARVRFVAKDGRYLPPVGHREEINPGAYEDSGAGVVLGGDTYAYVDGTFEIDLPLGAVDVEVVKGFEHTPVRRTLIVTPQTRELSIEIDRAIDLRAAGWRSADPHVHFLAPSTAMLQAAAEDVTFVHVLATQLGDEYASVADLAFGSLQDRSGRHLVMVGTENRSNMLGHLGLLGGRRPVLPMASGGAPEGRIGAPVTELLADWADRCHAQGGLVVGAHFPLPLAEIAAAIVAGRIDAIEMQTFAPGLDNPTVTEWYRFLDCGYRLPLIGGTDKMSAEMPLGAIRTYTRLDPDREPTFDAWAAAVRAGRTFATSGPLIELLVDGHEPGDVLGLPASGGRLDVQVRARAAQPVIGCVELVVNGRVVAREDALQGAADLRLDTTLDVVAGSWIAARSRSDHQIRSAYLTSMASHTSPVYVEVVDRPQFSVVDAEAILAVIDGTVRWLETMASIEDPARRARMVRQVAASGKTLRDRIASPGEQA